MGFEEAVRSGFRNWNRTAGRSRRSEYWWWALFFFLAVLGSALVVGFIGALVGGGDRTSSALLGLALVVVVFALIVPTIAVSIRRLHDTNRSGWWLLITFIPYIGSIILLVFYCLDGSPGPNRFGDRPGGNLPTYRPDGPLIGVADEIKKLEELRAAGTITDEEFSRQRSRLMPG